MALFLSIEFEKRVLGLYFIVTEFQSGQCPEVSGQKKY